MCNVTAEINKHEYSLKQVTFLVSVDTSPVQEICTFLCAHLLQLGPDRYVGLPILSANIGLLQIYQYQHICSPMYVDIATVLRLETCLD